MLVSTLIMTDNMNKYSRNTHCSTHVKSYGWFRKASHNIDDEHFIVWSAPGNAPDRRTSHNSLGPYFGGNDLRQC